MKAIGGVLLVFAVLYLGLCFMSPSEVKASRSTEIEAPASAIYGNVSDFKNWKDWMPWYKDNPDMTFEFEEQTAGVGAGYSWKSENAGNGSMKILEAEQNKSMKTEIDFEGMGISYGSWNFEPVGDKTKVTWGMHSSEPLPFLIRGFLKLSGMQGQLDGDFDKGLASLKEIVEAQVKSLPTSYDGYEVALINLPETTYVGAQREIGMVEMQAFFASSFGAAMGTVATNKLEMVGMPTACFYSWDEKGGKTDLFAGVPVNKAPEIMKEGIKIVTIPAGKALNIDYYGDFSGSAKAHEAMDKYISQRGWTATYPVLEQYVTDPTIEPDTSKWLTKVTYMFSEN